MKRVWTIAIVALISINISQAGKLTKKNLQKHVGFLASEELQGRFPHSEGSQKARDYITKSLMDSGITDIYIQQGKPIRPLPRHGAFPTFPANNIIAKYPATTATDKCIVYSAHYDNGHKNPKKFFPGANDNASGVAALLELGRQLVVNKIQTNANIYLTFPDLEELYINGSPSMVKHLLDSECKEIILNVNLDIVGGAFFAGMEGHLLELSSGLTADHYQFIDSADKHGLNIHSSNIYLIEPLGNLVPRSDYSSFRASGVPFIFYTAGTPWYYHTQYDSIDKVDFDFLQNVVFRIYSLAKNYSVHAPSLTNFSYNNDQTLNLAKDASNFAEILQIYIDNREQNHLTDRQVKRFSKYIKKFKDPEFKATKLKLHKSVIDLIISVKSSGKYFSKSSTGTK